MGDLDVGLSDSELQAVERSFNFSIPIDLRAFLKFALPIPEKPRTVYPDYPRPPGYPGEAPAFDGFQFPNWCESGTKLQFQMDLPIDGVLFDVRTNEFWVES